MKWNRKLQLTCEIRKLRLWSILSVYFVSMWILSFLNYCKRRNKILTLFVSKPNLHRRGCCFSKRKQNSLQIVHNNSVMFKLFQTHDIGCWAIRFLFMKVQNYILEQIYNVSISLFTKHYNIRLLKSRHVFLCTSMVSRSLVCHERNSRIEFRDEKAGTG